MGLTVDLDPKLVERIKFAADAAGLSVDDFVGRSLQAWLDDWTDDLNRLAEPGDDVEAAAALDRFDARIAERLSERK